MFRKMTLSTVLVSNYRVSALGNYSINIVLNKKGLFNLFRGTSINK